jgi:hypothetical protein
VENKISHLNSEQFRLHMESYEDERQAQEEKEILRLKVVAASKRLRVLKESHGQEQRTVERAVKQRNKEFKHKCKGWTRQTTEN